MNSIQTKRLLNVAKALRDAHAAKAKFTMERWLFGELGDVEYVWDEETGNRVTCNTEENFCGTPACALGHYASRTDLQRLLKVSILKDDHKTKYASMDYFGEKAGSGIGWWDERLQGHFGLNNEELEELFGGDGCGNARTSLQAAKFIEKFVAKQQFPRTPRSTTEV